MTRSNSREADDGSELGKLFATANTTRAGNRRWIASGAALIAIVGVGLVLVLRVGKAPTGPRYLTERARMGTLVVKVSATGNLQPTNNVQVGSELSGIVTEVLVDDNDAVTKGQVLAQLDLSRLKDAVAKSQASLAAAEAFVLQAEATVLEARAALTRFKQVHELSGGKVPSQAEMDTAVANLKRAEANEASARASITQARANLQSDETNLDKASIRSPIDGVVLTRNVEPGQTVAATLQAPVLFTVAEDLAKMELLVDVDEADVAQVKIGQEATFTVDAWPGRKYKGVITRVGFGSQLKDGVVSYPTVLTVNNDDLSLRPGMTGTAEIVTITRENVLLVPNAALRFTPPAPEATSKESKGGDLVGKLMPRPMSQPLRTRVATSDAAPRVWVLRDEKPAPIDIELGATNGQQTEVLGGPLAVDMEIITELVSPAL